MNVPKTIAFLGPTGTYSDEATHAFAHELSFATVVREYASFHEIFEAVGNGMADLGVVATENSLEGPVTATLDDFASRDDFEIVGEHIVDIHHCLLLNASAGLEDVEAIASHPQGLAQCRRFIRENLPGRKAIATSSTSEAARLAASNPHIAGIASAHAAALYGARVFADGIEDHQADQTAFALIARKGTPPVFDNPACKTSLVLFLKANRPGALLMILSEFAYAAVNLTKIQSRPTKRVLGEYLFFIDVEGSADDADIATAIASLRLKLREVKVLGSYPVI